VIQKRNEVAKQTKVLASMDKRKVAEESPASEDAASEPEPPEVRWTRIHPLAPIKRLVCDIHAPYHCMIIGAIVHGISVLEVRRAGGKSVAREVPLELVDANILQRGLYESLDPSKKTTRYQTMLPRGYTPYVFLAEEAFLCVRPSRARTTSRSVGPPLRISQKRTAYASSTM